MVSSGGEGWELREGMASEGGGELELKVRVSARERKPGKGLNSEIELELGIRCRKAALTFRW